MNEVWNLESIYSGFDDPAFSQDMAAMSQTLTQLQALVETLNSCEPRQALRDGLLLQEELYRFVEKAAGYAEFRMAANTLDDEASSRFGQVMGVYSEAAGAMAAFRGWAAKLPNLDECIQGDPLLEEYRFLLECGRASSRYLLNDAAESVMAKLKISGGSAWAELQQYLTSTVPVTFRGETTNLSAIRGMAHSADPQIRQEAFEAELSCFPAIQDSVAFALNAIKLETLSECRLRGYASPLDKTLHESHLERATLDAMFAAIDEYLPKFRQYLRAKGSFLGHKNGLPWYDLFAPVGRSAAAFTPESARDYLVEVFSRFDTELSEMVRRAFDEAWIDFYPRSGKTGGAFCSGVECLGQSRILTNFDGSLESVITLAHELGHAFHNQCIRGHRILNHDYSMPVAETASTFNECVVMNHAIANAADDWEKMALIESQLKNVTQIIVDIYSRYRFEAQVFAKRPESFMPAAALCEMMLDAQRACYGDGLDENVLHPYMWVVKSHYYGPIFYNFPYAFGGLFARGLYARYEQMGADFVPKYKQLLCTTPVATAEDTARVLDIDLTTPDFWRSALDTVAEKIDLFCELAEKLK